MNPELLIGLSLCAIFVIFAALMYSGKLPALIALPLMAAAVYVVAASFYPALNTLYYGAKHVALAKGFLTVVISEGMPKLWHYMVAVILGAILSEQLKASGASKTIIKWAGELGGDNPTLVCLLLVFACCVLFTALSGLGSVIMVASIVLPLMLALGVSAEVAGCLFLFGLCLGGTFNLVNWEFYITLLVQNAKMSPADAMMQVFKFMAPMFGLFWIATIIFIVVNTRKGFSSLWAARASSSKEPKVSAAGLLTPIVPILILLPCNGYNLYKANVLHLPVGFAFPVNAALLAGVIYGVLVLPRPKQGRIQGLTKCIFEAISATAPVAALIIGIGMIIRVVMDPAVSFYMKPIIENIVPNTKLLYIVVFGLLAPLALYRGPLNVWGMGSAMAALLIATGKIQPVAVMAMLISVGQVQGLSDPTNTHNVWLAGYLGADVQVFTRRTLAYSWGLAVAGLAMAAVFFIK